MKYKAGDKVKIKTWEVMEKEYGLNTTTGSISCYGGFNYMMEKDINNLNSNRVVTIEHTNNTIYHIEGNSYAWTDDMIECLASEYKEPIPISIPIPIPILSRFEILDL